MHTTCEAVSWGPEFSACQPRSYKNRPDTLAAIRGIKTITSYLLMIKSNKAKSDSDRHALGIGRSI